MGVNVTDVNIAERASYRAGQFFGQFYANIWREIGEKSKSTLLWWQWGSAVNCSYSNEEYGYRGLTALLEHVSDRPSETFRGIREGIKKNESVQEFDNFTSGLVQLMAENERFYTVEGYKKSLVQSIDKIGGIEEYKRLVENRNTAISDILGYLEPIKDCEKDVIEDFMKVEKEFFRRSIELYNEGIPSETVIRERLYEETSNLGCLSMSAAIVLASILSPIIITTYLIANYLNKKASHHNPN